MLIKYADYDRALAKWTPTHNKSRHIASTQLVDVRVIPLQLRYQHSTTPECKISIHVWHNRASVVFMIGHNNKCCNAIIGEQKSDHISIAKSVDVCYQDYRRREISIVLLHAVLPEIVTELGAFITEHPQHCKYDASTAGILKDNNTHPFLKLTLGNTTAILWQFDDDKVHFIPEAGPTLYPPLCLADPEITDKLQAQFLQHFGHEKIIRQIHNKISVSLAALARQQARLNQLQVQLKGLQCILNTSNQAPQSAN